MMKGKIIAALVVAIFVIGGVWWWRVRRDPIAGGMSPAHFVQLPHDVSVVKFVNEGRLLMLGSGSEDGAVTFLDAQTGEMVRSWRGGGENIWLSENTRRALTMNYEPRANKYHYVLHDALSGAILRAWTDKARSESVARDLSIMVVIERGADSSHGRVIEISTGRERGQFVPPKIFWNGVRLSRTARYLSLNGSKDAPARVLSMSDLQPVLELPPLSSVIVANDENRLIGIDSVGTIHFWDLSSKRHRTVATKLDRTNWIYETFDGRLVIDGGMDNPPLNSLKPEVTSYSSVLQVRSRDGAELLHEFTLSAMRTFSSEWALCGFRSAASAEQRDLSFGCL